MIFIIFTFILISTSAFSITLQPFQSTPHIKLCNLDKKCEQLLLVLDTGSPDLWIADQSCANCPKKSTHCIDKNNIKTQGSNIPSNLSESQIKQIHYGIGWVKGYEIDFKLCGIMTKILCVTNARDIQHYGSDGVIGIAGNSTGKQFLMKLIKQLEMPNTISFYFGNYFTELTIGGYNNEYIKDGSILSYFEASPQWTLNINQLKINDTIVSQNILALVDTGSSLFVFPTFIYNYILKQIEDTIKLKCIEQNYGISCPCQNSDTLLSFPTIQFDLKNSNQNITSFRLEPKHYVYQRNHKCIGQILSFKEFNELIILGAPFLRHYITLFDFEKQMIGIIQGDKQRIKISEQYNLVIITLFTITLVMISTKISLMVIGLYQKQNMEGKLII